jgi:hypothetical protein
MIASSTKSYAHCAANHLARRGHIPSAQAPDPPPALRSFAHRRVAAPWDRTCAADILHWLAMLPRRTAKHRVRNRGLAKSNAHCAVSLELIRFPGPQMEPVSSRSPEHGKRMKEAHGRIQARRGADDAQPRPAYGRASGRRLGSQREPAPSLGQLV